MRAIFLSGGQTSLDKIYTDEAYSELKNLLDLERRVYTYEELLASPDAFSDVEIILSSWGMPPLSEQEIKRILPSLRAVFYAAGSVQRFARPFLASGVRVFSAWAANAIPVAEVTAAQIVLANKGYFVSTRAFVDGGHAEARASRNRCIGNYDEEVGIIGAGMIGRKVISLLKNYRLRVLVFDPFLSDERAKELGVERVQLTELFSRCMAVSNHLANNAETVGMLRYEHFSVMRENGVFINTGRGAQVVEQDLVRALTERPDLTALLDVTYPEPPEEGHPFYTLPNCILSPHLAGSFGREVGRMGDYMLSELRRYLAGEACPWEVTAAMLTTMA